MRLGEGVTCMGTAVSLCVSPSLAAGTMSIKRRFSFRQLLRKSADLDGELKGSCSLSNLGSHTHLSQPRPLHSSTSAWAAGFERLLQDPAGVSCFSEFLKKEFSEENILFWQACEFFSQVPASDKKQLAQKADEIYRRFLSSRATTPVNIDSQAQLADDVLNAPRPDMFKEQQLQIFNLMKFDSYSRFLRSSVYHDCRQAEIEGRPLPDPQQAPGSPSSKHSVGSELSDRSTPRKEGRKLKSRKSVSEDCRDEQADKKKSIFSSWSRSNRSFGKGPKRREAADSLADLSQGGRRESQGSLSSGTSLELMASGLRSEQGEQCCDKDSSTQQCSISLPDGSRCSLTVRPGLSIRQLLVELCNKLSVNLAAVDLFLVGGDKPLVLDQESMTLSSRCLRLEKRTLFRLDIIPINRSVGLKAKPTKPVTEVLRPVVAKYGLHLNNLVARISGHQETLDLGLPISTLDGLRVVLDVAEHAAGKGEKPKADGPKGRAPMLAVKSHSITEKPAGRSWSARGRGENGHVTLHQPLSKDEKRKQEKMNIDDAEEFFELLSRAQSSRADDQRGLLSKEDLVLPDFLRVSGEPSCSTPTSRRNALGASRQSHSLDSALSTCGHAPSSTRRPLEAPPAPFVTPLSPIRNEEEEEEEEGCVGDLTLVGEGDVSSPNHTLLHNLTSHLDAPPTSGAAGSEVDVDGVRLEESPQLNLSLEGFASELRECVSRSRAAVCKGSDLPTLLPLKGPGGGGGATRPAFGY